MACRWTPPAPSSRRHDKHRLRETRGGLHATGLVYGRQEIAGRVSLRDIEGSVNALDGERRDGGTGGVVARREDRPGGCRGTGIPGKDGETGPGWRSSGIRPAVPAPLTESIVPAGAGSVEKSARKERQQ